MQCAAMQHRLQASTARSRTAGSTRAPRAAQAVRAVRGAAQCSSEGSEQKQAAGRRAILATGAALLAASRWGAAPARAEEEVAAQAPAAEQQQQQQPQQPFSKVEDSTLAYTFEYPTATASGRPIPLVFSRRPERYSSAAPLTADARQRIVCELADLVDAVTVSLTVGTPSGVLKSLAPEQWTPKLVAEQVLADRSTARITTGQRVSLNSVEASGSEQRDGATYYVYEHVSQGSPTLRAVTRETYRHSLAVTAVRLGQDCSPYLYTLNLSCPNELWDELQAGFQRGVDSFRLLAPGPDYVAPDQDPWRFF